MPRKPRFPRIFLSYSHKDKEFAMRLTKCLRQVLRDEDAVWFDYRLGGGEIWWQKIMKELTSRNTFIVLLSPGAVKSRWVKDEIHVAWRQRNNQRIFVPILCQQCTIPAELSFLENLQFISFLPTDDRITSFKKLLEALSLPSNVDVNPFIDDLIEQNTTRQENKMVSELGRLANVHIQKMADRIESAFEQGDWKETISIGKILRDLYPEDVPAEVYKKQGCAYLYAEEPCDEQYTLAKDALKRGLTCTHDPQERLDLLDIYTFILIKQGLREEVISCINEANKVLKLAPEHHTRNVWPLLQTKISIVGSDEDELIQEDVAPRTPVSNKIHRFKDIVLTLLLANIVIALLYRTIKLLKGKSASSKSYQP